MLKLVYNAAIAISNSDGGTLYICNKEEKVLDFEVTQIVMEEPDMAPPPVPLYVEGLPNHSNASSYVALTGETVNLPDVYEAKGFNFEGTKKYDMACDYRSKSMLVVPLKNHKKEVLGVLQLINAMDLQTGDLIEFSKEIEKIISSLASQAAVAITEAQLIQRLSQEIKETKKLEEAEKELNEKLRNAFLETNKANEKLTGALKKIKVVRRMAFLFVLILVAAGGIFGRSYDFLPESITGSPAAPIMQEGPSQTVQVMTQPISSSISMTGTLKPLKVVNLVSPVSGNIKKVNFEYGGLVKKKQVLVNVDSSEMQVKSRDAYSTYIKAKEKFEEMENWKDGSEVTKTRRSIAKAKLALETAKKNFEDTERLFKKDIVSETEYNSSKQQYISQQMDFQSAEEELQAILSKGDEKNKTIVQNELKNAQARLNETRTQLRRSTVYAPISGVILQPSASGGEKGPKVLGVGSPAKEGELLLSIGDLSGFSIKTKVDEVDVTKVQVGQKVYVTGDAFPGITLPGKVQTISSQAGESQGGYGGGAPSFDMNIVVDELTPEQKERIFIGMSANLEIIIYENPNALVLPVNVVEVMGDKAFVNKKTPGPEGASERVEVKTGFTTIDSVEIVDGLKEGDEVVYSMSFSMQP